LSAEPREHRRLLVAVFNILEIEDALEVGLAKRTPYSPAE